MWIKQVDKFKKMKNNENNICIYDIDALNLYVREGRCGYG
jgi:hypothetical protein